MDFSFFKVPVSRSPEEFDKESARLKKALEQAKEEVHFITLKPETLSEEELEKRTRLISENPYNKVRSINNAIKRLGQEKADILKPMTEQGDLGKTLGHIFLTPDNIDAALEAQGGRYVFKFPFEQGFATAEHVQDEFLSTLHVFTHIAPEKIPYLTESIMGNEFISPVTGRSVSAMVGQQLVANIQNIAMALEHCPEYQTFVSAHREELEAKTAMAEEILAFAAKNQAIETPKGKHSFVGQLEAKKTQERKRDSISNSSNSSLGFTTDSEGSTLGSEGITTDSESETSHSGSRRNSSYMEEEKIRRSEKNKEDRSL